MIENVYYINLKERTERKYLVERELNDMGWKYQRFDAVKDENHGRVGCTMSHLKLLTMAKEKNLEYIVIVEDDIQFMRKQWYNDKIKDIMNQDFDVFLLAGNIRPPVRLTEYKDTFKISNSFTTTGYIVKNHYYDSLIQNVKEGLQLLQKDPDGQYNSNAIDCHWMRLQAVDKWYMILPRTITQRPVYSDIEKRFTNYNHLMLDKIERIPQSVIKQSINLTLSTCFYIFNCKFNIETYKKWARNLIDNVNNFYLVVYTDEKSKYFFDDMNINDNIKLIIKEIETFNTYEYKDKWIKNHEKNTLLNDKIDWKVNMLWNEKINFVNETIKNEYFKTKFHGWCDIGYFRCNHDNLPLDKISNWPNKTSIENLEDKIYYTQVCNDNYINQIELYQKRKDEIPVEQCSIAGGFFICNTDDLKWWHHTYYNSVEQYLNSDKLIKDDQIIIIDLFLKYKDKFKLITQKNKKYDPWFAFDTYLL